VERLSWGNEVLKRRGCSPATPISNAEVVNWSIYAINFVEDAIYS
jgi:hypothetical protein